MKIKDTTELTEGDVVLNYGMRILIDGPAKIYKQGEDQADIVFVWPGLVLNADELCAKEFPTYNSYIASFLRGTNWEDRVPRTRQDEWNIQGNYLANWTVEDK